MAGKKGRSGGARRGAGRKRKLGLPVFSAMSKISGESADEILLQISAEEQILAALKEARKTDLRLWWAIMKELMHHAHGKPSPVHMIRTQTPVEPEPLTIEDIDRKIIELLDEMGLQATRRSKVQEIK